MSFATPEGEVGRAARAAVARVIQDMAAVRLGRGFLPLAGIFVYGAVHALPGGGGWNLEGLVLVFGAAAAAGGMLLYGNGAVRRALGRDGAAAALLAQVAGVVPYLFALYVLGAWGLRPLASAGRSIGGVSAAVFLTLLSGAYLWYLSRLTELHRLARVMGAPAPEEEGGG